MDQFQLYKIDGSGTATVMTYNGSTTVYNNPLGNGYKSGSICFVTNSTGGYEFVFTNESTVYASLGLVSWHYSYNVAANTVTALSGSHRTYSAFVSSIPGAQTGKLNTTFGNGKLYFAYLFERLVSKIQMHYMFCVILIKQLLY